MVISFLKPKPIAPPPKWLMLPAIIPSPNARGGPPTCGRIAQFPKKPLDIGVPWTQPPSLFIQQLNDDYAQAFPESRSPSSLDLQHWLYNRALDAEASVNILEQEVAALEEKVRRLEIEVRVLGTKGSV